MQEKNSRGRAPPHPIMGLQKQTNKKNPSSIKSELMNNNQLFCWFTGLRDTFSMCAWFSLQLNSGSRSYQICQQCTWSIMFLCPSRQRSAQRRGTKPELRIAIHTSTKKNSTYCSKLSKEKMLIRSFAQRLTLTVVIFTV